MKSSNREEIVDHDAKGLFDIVLDIESYPYFICLLYTSPSPRDMSASRMPSSA